MGIKERREREKQERRENIIAAAMQCFDEYGFENTTMDLIAEKAELSKGTLYIYFQSKQEIYWAISMQTGDKALAQVEKDFAAATTGKEKLLAIKKNITEFYKTHKDLLEIFRTAFKFMSTFIRDHMEDARKHDDRLMELMLEAIEAGQKDGSIQLNEDPQKYVMTTYVASISLLMFLIEFGDMMRDAFGVDPAEIIEHQNQIFFDRILR